MRALLVAAAPVPGSVDLVAELASRSDLDIAVDGGGAVCLDAGVTPDVVLGDFDSLSPDALARLTEAGARVVAFPTRKNHTDLELAFERARDSGATEVVVTCTTSGRLDHTLAALGALSANSALRPELAEPSVAGWVLSPQGRQSLALVGLGATVSLVATGGPAIVSATGVEWPIDRLELPPSSGLGVSNVIVAPSGATIDVHGGTVLVPIPQRARKPRPYENQITMPRCRVRRCVCGWHHTQDE